VDQSSRDETVSIVKHFAAKIAVLPFGGMYLPPTRSRNLGSGLSSGQYLLHLDSDMELSPGVVESCVEMSLRGTRTIVIPEVDAYDNYWGRCKALERSCYLGDPINETPRFFPTDIFRKIGGFDENLNAGEDWDIRIRLQDANIPIARTEHYLNHHIEGFDFFKNLSKKLNYARSFDKYQRKHPEASKQNLTILRPALWRSRSKLAADPAHALGLWIQKVAESYCTWVGMRRPFGRS
jgi:arabinofuranan 3-O-arabinosyltransferase